MRMHLRMHGYAQKWGELGGRLVGKNTPRQSTNVYGAKYILKSLAHGRDGGGEDDLHTSHARQLADELSNPTATLAGLLRHELHRQPLAAKR